MALQSFKAKKIFKLKVNLKPIGRWPCNRKSKFNHFNNFTDKNKKNDFLKDIDLFQLKYN